MEATAIAAVISLGFELLRQYMNKPPGWIPAPEDIAALNASIDEATPEHEKALARERLGLPPA